MVTPPSGYHLDNGLLASWGVPNCCLMVGSCLDSHYGRLRPPRHALWSPLGRLYAAGQFQ